MSALQNPAAAEDVTRARAPRTGGGDRHVLLGLVVLAALLRLPALTSRSLWGDEAYTVAAVEGSLGRLVAQLVDAERTPPLDYALAWLWVHLFGTGEVGLRSLSAVLGVSLVPVAWLLGRERLGRRAGVVLAALVATNPFLVWHSSEARAYALLGPLLALQLLLFMRWLRRANRGVVVSWAAVGALAVATHYFAVLALVPQAAALLWRRRFGRPATRWAVLAASGVVVLAGSAVAVIRLQPPTWFGETSLLGRLVDVPVRLLIAHETDSYAAAAVPVLLVAGGFALALRDADPGRRRTARWLLGLCVAASLPLVAGAVAGFDFVTARNFLPALLPALTVVAAGFARADVGRLGTAGTLVLCAVSTVVVLATAHVPKYGIYDDRAVAEAIGPADTPRLLVLAPRERTDAALRYALPGTTQLLRRVRTVTVTELDRVLFRDDDEDRPPSRAERRPPDSGFSLLRVQRVGRAWVLRYRAPRPTSVAIPSLCAPTTPGLRLLLQRAGAGRRPAGNALHFPEGLGLLPTPRSRCPDGQAPGQ